MNNSDKAKFWNAALDIDELRVDLENISADDKRPLESYSVKEVVSEAEYILSTFFEPGTLNGDSYDGEHSEDEQKWAYGEVRKLRNLIAKYSKVAA
jgi:hypothetical protein